MNTRLCGNNQRLSRPFPRGGACFPRFRTDFRAGHCVHHFVGDYTRQCTVTAIRAPRYAGSCLAVAAGTTSSATAGGGSGAAAPGSLGGAGVGGCWTSPPADDATSSDITTASSSSDTSLGSAACKPDAIHNAQQELDLDRGGLRSRPISRGKWRQWCSTHHGKIHQTG